MSILVPGFSERVFEFSFNAEYADRNRAVLAGAPSIPTQNEEKWLGYDVLFEVNRRGGAIHALALQHKVPRFVDQLGPKNAHFWAAVGGPYYAFRIDVDQYNLIEAVASANLPGVEFCYSSPIFASRHEMNSHYLAKSVEANSVWIDVAGAGQLDPNEPHSIVYSPDGARSWVFSGDGRPLKTRTDAVRRARWSERRNAPPVSIPALYRTALEAVHRYWPKRTVGRRAASPDEAFRLPQQAPTEELPTYDGTARLLAQYFGASFLLEVRT
jgi:hypothetical protein